MRFMEYLQNNDGIIELFVRNDERIERKEKNDGKTVRCKWIGKDKKVFGWIQ